MSFTAAQYWDFLFRKSLRKRQEQAVILSEIETDKPDYTGIEKVTANTNTYLRIFGKPVAHVGRRMGVVVCYDKVGADLNALRDKCKAAAANVKVIDGNN